MRFTSIFVYLLCSLTTCFGWEHSFILQNVKSNEILVQEGDVNTRFSPYCSFNICLSLIGFNTLILQDLTHPEWPYKEEHKTWNDFFRDKWAAPQNPTTWMHVSCVWFSQELTQKIGFDRLSQYVNAFNYGNRDLSGDIDKENGLTRAWIGTSLRISPLEQINLINRLLKHELPVSANAHEYTKTLLFIETLPNGMKLYGKTGSGWHAFGQETEWRIGWFVGFVEREGELYSLVYMVQGPEQDVPLTGIDAREHLKTRLSSL